MPAALDIPVRNAASRGVAALFYAAIVAGSGALSETEADIVVWTTIVCVVFSIVVHGSTSTALTRRLLSR